VRKYRMGSMFTVVLTIAEARGPGLDYAVPVWRLELGVPGDNGIWVEEFTSERSADLFLGGCRAALWMSHKSGDFPTSVQQIINFGKECE